MADKDTVYLCGITLQNIQNYKEPTFIPFSKKLTIIKAPNNNTGKSTIQKAMAVFRSEPSKSLLMGLLRHKKYENKKTIDKAMQGSVTLFLSNGNRMYAQLDRVTVKSSKREVINITYILYDSNNTLIKRWDNYSEEITRYLNWVTLSVEGESYSLNFKESGNHLFINTSLKMNTEALNNLCYIEEIETKINNLKNAIERLSNAQKFIAGDLMYRKNMLSQAEYVNVELLKYQKDMLLTYKQKLVELKHRFHIFDLLNKSLELEQQNMVLNKIKNLIDLNTSKSRIDNLSNHLANKQLSDKINNLLQDKVTINSLSNVETRLSQLDNTILTDKLNSLTDKMVNIKVIDNNLNRLNMLLQRQDVNNRLVKLISSIQISTSLTALDKLDKNKQILDKIKNLNSILEITNDLEKVKSELNYHSTLSNLSKLISLKTSKNSLNMYIVQTQKRSLLESLEQITMTKQADSEVSKIEKSTVKWQFLTNTKLYLEEFNKLNNIKLLFEEICRQEEIRERLLYVKTLIPVCPTCGQIFKGDNHHD